MDDCTEEMEECYDDDDFEKMRQQSYEVLNKILQKMNVNFRCWNF